MTILFCCQRRKSVALAQEWYLIILNNEAKRPTNPKPKLPRTNDLPSRVALWNPIGSVGLFALVLCIGVALLAAGDWLFIWFLLFLICPESRQNCLHKSFWPMVFVLNLLQLMAVEIGQRMKTLPSYH